MILLAVVISTVIATAFYLPILCYFLFRTRSFRESHAQAWAAWKHIASEILTQIH
ncbi:hypothetical protein Pla8534_68780 [Lignipirellula cremea]|uniref:Uncharacterized protein n=1 Tax=Lignipirellula cremea TaxID=2528010 RepID=A0A518E4E4_9BACT|nr:hypothetical protein Pla8534_68780 [Lignipirellula cremea]